jgi:hypothetical protein
VTIAACYVSPEGVVLGADSTATFNLDQPGGPGKLPHYFNYAQKLFEISHVPETETLGIVTWGLGGVGPVSHRTLIGRFADDLKATPAITLQDAVTRWIAMFWNEWTTIFKAEHARFKQLYAMPTRTPQEDEELSALFGLGVGFCFAGIVRATIEQEVPMRFFSTLKTHRRPFRLQSHWVSPPFGAYRICSNGYCLA